MNVTPILLELLPDKDLECVALEEVVETFILYGKSDDEEELPSSLDDDAVSMVGVS